MKKANSAQPAHATTSVATFMPVPGLTSATIPMVMNKAHAAANASEIFFPTVITVRVSIALGVRQRSGPLLVEKIEAFELVSRHDLVNIQQQLDVPLSRCHSQQVRRCDTLAEVRCVL